MFYILRKKLPCFFLFFLILFYFFLHTCSKVKEAWDR